MKKISLIAFAILLFTSCTKNMKDMSSEIMLQETKNDQVPATRPMKIEFYSTVNESSPALTCTMPGVPFGIANSGYFLHGNATHIGSISSDYSFGQDGFCNLSAAFILSTKTSGQIVAPNGDKLFYEGDDLIDLNNVVFNGGTTAAITGLWTITGGTGKFISATGSFTIDGVVDVASPGGPTFKITGEGIITY